MSRDKVIAVDFDGVIHQYSKGWNGGRIYDAPVFGVVDAIHKLQVAGFRIVVFTCRVFDVIHRERCEAWLWDHDIRELDGTHIEVTNIKPPAIAYIDDRGIRFTNWADMLKYFV